MHDQRLTGRARGTDHRQMPCRQLCTQHQRIGIEQVDQWITDPRAPTRRHHDLDDPTVERRPHLAALDLQYRLVAQRRRPCQNALDLGQARRVLVDRLLPCRQCDRLLFRRLTGGVEL